MGLNISGLVIDKNYKNDLKQIETILGEELILEKEVVFEEAIENWKEDTYCDIYFSEKGTFILLSMETGGFDFYAENQTAFSFVLSEMSMTFCINYTKDGELVRSIMESEEMNEDEGEPFAFEKEEDDKSELIYHLIEQTLGESFDDIDWEARCFRYSYKRDEQAGSESAKDTSEGVSSEKKPWWKFW
jgi:hypothetical protein